MIGDCQVRQRVQSTSPRVLLNLTIPAFAVESPEPVAICRELFVAQRDHSTPKFFDLQKLSLPLAILALLGAAVDSHGITAAFTGPRQTGIHRQTARHRGSVCNAWLSAGLGVHTIATDWTNDVAITETSNEWPARADGSLNRG